MYNVRRPPIEQAAASGIGGSLKDCAMLTQGRHVHASVAHHVEIANARGCGTRAVLIHPEYAQHGEHDASAEGSNGGAGGIDSDTQDRRDEVPSSAGSAEDQRRCRFGALDGFEGGNAHDELSNKLVRFRRQRSRAIMPVAS